MEKNSEFQLKKKRRKVIIQCPRYLVVRIGRR